MTAFAFGHRLDTIYEGLTGFVDGVAAFVPLESTNITVSVKCGIATVRTRRCFQNLEDTPIEAILTMPVGSDSVVTGLNATIDGRVLVAESVGRLAARETYEAALDAGKMAVLHEEVLHGVHVLSVGQLGPGKSVFVELETVTCLGLGGRGLFLRIPMTVGHVYGTSPLMPVDDLSVSSRIQHRATLTVTIEDGMAILGDEMELPSGQVAEISLDKAIELQFPGETFGSLAGQSGDGRNVRIDMKPIAETERPLELAIVFDRSGSTASRVDVVGDRSIAEAMKHGLSSALSALRSDDQINLWQFNQSCELVGVSKGPDVNGLIHKLEEPKGGTQLADAIKTAVDSGVPDILVLTDGKTWEADPYQLVAVEARISAILIGPDSLDASIGRICAMTGGQIFYAVGGDVQTAVEIALRAMRNPGGQTKGKVENGKPLALTTVRNGVCISAHWSENDADTEADTIGCFAASLALPLIQGERLVRWSRMHRLCTNQTSLVLVDEQGPAHEGISNVRKIPLSISEANVAFSENYQPQDLLPSASFRPIPTVPESIKMKLPSQTLHWPKGFSWRRILGIINAGRNSVKQPEPSPFSGFDWFRQADAVTQGDFSCLTASQLELVVRHEGFSHVKDLAKRYAVAPRLVALALIALNIGNRDGARFAHRIMAKVPIEEWGGSAVSAFLRRS